MFNIKNKLNSLYLSLFMPHGKYLSDLQKAYNAIIVVSRYSSETCIELDMLVISDAMAFHFIDDICKYADTYAIKLIFNINGINLNQLQETLNDFGFYNNAGVTMERYPKRIQDYVYFYKNI